MIKLTRSECPNPAALENNNYKHEDNKVALKKSTFGKCMYCESKIEHNSFAEIEHIKPKSKYPELEFSWDNLGYSCKRCNHKKWNKFDEKLPFINPYNENPEEHIKFIDYLASHISERGAYTIRELDLNRAGLIEIRKEKLIPIKQLISLLSKINKNTPLGKQTISELKEYAKEDKEYSAMIKHQLNAQKIL